MWRSTRTSTVNIKPYKDANIPEPYKYMFQTTSEQVSGSLELIILYIVPLYTLGCHDCFFFLVMNELLEDHEDRLAKAYDFEVWNLAVPTQVCHRHFEGDDLSELLLQ